MKNRHAAKNRPVTEAERPVRAPSPTPVADSMKTVWPEALVTPPIAPPAPSMKRALLRPGILPAWSASLASWPTAMMVAIASKKPASTRVKTTMATAA